MTTKQVRTTSADLPLKRELALRIAEHIKAGLTNTDALVAQPIEMRFNEMLEGVRADLSVKVFGPDPQVLERLGRALVGELEHVSGVADLQAEVLFGAAQLQNNNATSLLRAVGYAFDDHITEPLVTGVRAIDSLLLEEREECAHHLFDHRARALA